MEKLRKYFIFCSMVLCLLGSALVAHAETIEVPHEEDYMDNVYATPAASTIAHSYSVQTGEEVSGYPEMTSILPFTIQQYQGHLNFFTLRMDKFVQTYNGKYSIDKYRHGYAFWVVSDAPFKVGVENLTTASYDSKNSMYTYLLTSGGGSYSDNNNYECTLPNQVVYSNDLSYSSSGLQAQRDFIADLVDFSRDIVDSPPVFDENDLYLTDFSCNSSITATWSGVHTPEGFSIDDVDVVVSCGYTVFLNSDENEREDFDHPAPETIRASLKTYSRPLADYYASNPYDGRCVLFIRFTPYIMGVKGKAVEVSFDANKNMSMTVPDSALTETYSSDLYFVNPMANNEFHNWGDSYIYFYWTSVSVEGEVDYLSSSVNIELYCHDDSGSWSWIPYNDDIYSFKSRKISFNLTSLESFASSNGVMFGKENAQGNYAGEKIKIYPSYSTGSQLVKGKAVIIELGTLGGVKSITQLEEDGTSTNLDPTYNPIDGIGDVIGSDDNGSFDLDVSDLGKMTVKFFDMIKVVFSACGQFPSLFANVFSFLPSYYTSMLMVGLILVIILRILGR